MKKINVLIISLLAFCISQTSFAYRCSRPAYLGFQLGGCDLHYDKSDLARGALSVDDKGFAGRLIAGIDISQNIGLELGYTAYQNPEFKYLGGVTTDFSQQSLDFLAKLSVPVSCNVSLYAKAGMAFVHRDDAEITRNNVTIRITDEDNFFRPMLGLGVSYDFNRSVSGDIGYFRTFGTEDLEDADFYGAGLTFRIG